MLAIALAGPEEAGTGIAVAPMATSGDVRPVAVQRIQEAFLEGLGREGLRVVPPDEVTKASSGAGDCADAGCLSGVAKDVGTTHAVKLSVAVSGRDYNLAIQLVSADGAKSEAQAECPICGFDEVAEVATQEALKLAGRLLEAREPAVLRVSTQPPGATVYVDDQPFGTTPVEEQLPEGNHAIRVELDGYVVRTREVTSVAGVAESLDVELQPLPKKGNTKALFAAGGALAAIGVGGIAGGATLLAFHHKEASGRCDKPENIDMNGLCRWRYNTLAPGIGTLAAGFAAAVTGTALIIVAATRKGGGSNKRARLEPRLGGMAVVF